MRPSIVWASILVLGYEIFAIRSHRCDPWTILAKNHTRSSGIIWGYWLWLGAHLLTGGRV